MNLQQELEAAIGAVTQACRLCETVRADIGPVGVVTKGDQSPVTLADYGAQAVVSRELRRAFPDTPLVAEEDTSDLLAPARAELRARITAHVQRILPDLSADEILDAIASGGYAGGPTGRFWTLDPIDGTKGFLRGGQYAVALALIQDGQVLLGVLGCPNLPLTAAQPAAGAGCLFTAVHGEGARQYPLHGDGGAANQDGGAAIQVDQIEDPTLAAFCESVEAGHSSHDEAAQIAARLGVTTPPVRMDSQCKYAAVARGDASIYLRLPVRADYQEKIWDHAAGMLVIREAGGRVTDAHGRPLDFSRGRTLTANSGVVATNGRLHDRVLAAVAAVLSSHCASL